MLCQLDQYSFSYGFLSTCGALVAKGLSDGSHTELLPTPEQAALLAEGRQVITGVASPASSAPARNGAPRLSF